jgi:membrane protein required for colicin V production
MNLIDIIIIGIFVWAIIRGYLKGLVMQLAALVALLVGIYISIRFSANLSDYLALRFKANTRITYFIAFGVLFALVVIFIHLSGRLIEKIMEISMLSFLNRLAGSVFSLVKSILIISVIISFLNMINQHFTFIPKEKTEKSFFYKPLSGVIPWLFPRIKNFNKKEKKTNEVIVYSGNTIHN